MNDPGGTGAPGQAAPGAASQNPASEEAIEEPAWVEPMRRVILAGGKTLIKTAAKNISASTLGFSAPRQNPPGTDSGQHDSADDGSGQHDSKQRETESAPDPTPTDQAPSEVAPVSTNTDSPSSGPSAEETGTENPIAGAPSPEMSAPGDAEAARQNADLSEGDLGRVDAEGQAFWIEVQGIEPGASGRIEYVGKALSSVPALSITTGEQVRVSSGNVTTHLPEKSRHARSRPANGSRNGSRKHEPPEYAGREHASSEQAPGEQDPAPSRSVTDDENKNGPITRHWE
jgi:hypothetical protein